MKYECFNRILSLYQTKSIHALNIPDSCDLEQIPSAFAFLLPDILAILQKNMHHLCEPNQSIAIFGLQPSGGFLISDLPSRLDRIIHTEVPGYHLCCTLDYIPLQPNQSIKTVNWTKFKSVIVDFTRGLIMDVQQYCHELFQDNDIPPGTILGAIDQQKVTTVWEIVRSEGYHIVSGRL